MIYLVKTSEGHFSSHRRRPFVQDRNRTERLVAYELYKSLEGGDLQHVGGDSYKTTLNFKNYLEHTYSWLEVGVLSIDHELDIQLHDLNFQLAMSHKERVSQSRGAVTGCFQLCRNPARHFIP